MAQRMTYFSLSTKEHLSQHLGTFNGPEKRHDIRRTLTRVRTCSGKFDSSTVPSAFSTDFLRFFQLRQQQQHKAAKSVGQVLSCFASDSDTLTTLQLLIESRISFPFPSCPTLQKILERPVVTQAKVMPQSSITVRKTPASNTASPILRF